MPWICWWCIIMSICPNWKRWGTWSPVSTCFPRFFPLSPWNTRPSCLKTAKTPRLPTTSWKFAVDNIFVVKWKSPSWALEPKASSTACAMILATWPRPTLLMTCKTWWRNTWSPAHLVWASAIWSPTRRRRWKSSRSSRTKRWRCNPWLTRSTWVPSKTTRRRPTWWNSKPRSTICWTRRQSSRVKSAVRVSAKTTASSWLSIRGQRAHSSTFRRWFRVWDNRTSMVSVFRMGLIVALFPISTNTTIRPTLAGSSRILILTGWPPRNSSSTRWVVVSVWLIRLVNQWREIHQLYLLKTMFRNIWRLAHGLMTNYTTIKKKLLIKLKKIWNSLTSVIYIFLLWTKMVSLLGGKLQL